MPQAVAGKRQIAQFKELQEEARVLTDSFARLMAIKKARDNGQFPFNSGTNPQYEVSDDDAIRLGYPTASDINNLIDGFVNSMNSIDGNGFMLGIEAVANVVPA